MSADEDPTDTLSTAAQEALSLLEETVEPSVYEIAMAQVSKNDPSKYEIHTLLALQSKPMYGGTVTEKVRQRRRQATKTARASRRRNRRP